MAAQRTYKLGTRSSPLAMWQAHRVRDRLHEVDSDVEIEIVQIQTTGDQVLDKPLVQVGGKGIFTKEIEQALLDGVIDFAVHSLKDLPTILPRGLEVTCIPERSSPYDALFSPSAVSLRTLPQNPTIATGSLRRRAQILHLLPNARVVDIRGNVNTRLKKYQDSDWEGFIMAHAAALRMGWRDQVKPLSTLELLPAPAQGALAIESRGDDVETQTFLAFIHDPAVAPAVYAERAFLATLEGGCQVPLAAYSARYGNCLALTGLIASLDGKRLIRKTGYGDIHTPHQLGEELASTLLADGGKEIKDELMDAITL